MQETQRLARDPFLADRFRDGIDKGEGDLFRQFDLVRFADRIGLRPLERLVLASSVISAQRKELANQAANIIRLALFHNPSFDYTHLPLNQVAKLMSNLLCNPPSKSPVPDIIQVKTLIAAAQTEQPRSDAGSNQPFFQITNRSWFTGTQWRWPSSSRSLGFLTTSSLSLPPSLSRTPSSASFTTSSCLH